MNYKFKMRQRVTALCMAAMMCCGMLPYGALAEDSARPVVVATSEQAATQEAKSESDANSTATPETADESPDEDAPQQEPKTEGDTGGSDELYEIWHKMYWCCTIKVDIENSKGQYIEKDKQETTKDGSKSTKIQHGI